MNMTVYTVSPDQALETKLAKQAVAPRVTLDQINELVHQLEFKTHHFPGTTTTVAIAVMPNGFVAGIGKSSSVSLQNFNSVYGAEIAIDDARKIAKEKLWELEGYVLKKALS